MNVLLITFSFPPAGGVGVLRALSLAKYLPENGVRLDVLTARNAPSVGKDLSLLAQVPVEVVVHRCWTLDLPFGLRKAIKKRIAGNQRSEQGAATSSPTRAPHPLKRLLGDLLLPDPQVGWLPFAFPAARRIIRQRKIDLVLITVPPFSSVLLVSKLRKALPNLPIVLDFRDEWLSTTIDLVSFNNNARARAVAHKAESEAVRDASLIVAVTEAACHELRHRYPAVAPEKFHYLPNGFDSTDGPEIDLAAKLQTAAASQRPKTSETVTLTYLGTIYGTTDPTSFVDAVLGLADEARCRLRVRFIGHIESPAYRERLLQLGETVELKGFVPQAEALQAMADTDYLLLITRDRINVAAKFYDYLGGGKPILAAVDPAGDVRRLLDATGAGRWADVRDPNAISALLLSVLEPDAMVPTLRNAADYACIAGFHRRILTQRYAKILKQVVEQRSGEDGRTPMLEDPRPGG